jgi:dCMP deaminase
MTAPSMTVRATFYEYLLALAKAAATRGTCAKRQVGAVVADNAGFIVAVNYNGAPSGQPHCIDSPCKALTLPAPHSHLACRAVHGEANALLTAGQRAKGGSMSCTTSPCYECSKLIVAAGIKTLVVGEVNRLFDDEVVYSQTPRQLLTTAGVALVFLESQL